MALQVLENVKRSAIDIAQDVGLVALDVPERLSVRPVDPWQGDAEAGRALCDGVFTFQGQQVELYGEHWEPLLSQEWLEYLHGFSWLRDLRAVGTESARQQARALITSWMRQYPRADNFVWRPDVMGERLANLIAFNEFFQDMQDEGFQALYFESLVRQGRHLSRTISPNAVGVPQLCAVKGLLYLGLTLDGYDAWRIQALEIAKAQIAQQVLSDGGHVSRSPQLLMDALRVLIDMRTPLMAAGHEVPEFLAGAIERMAPALRFFRHGDKGFSLLHGALFGDQAQCDEILAQAGVRSKRLVTLERSGFERMSQGRTLVMFDCSTSPAAPYDRHAHAAPLSFEMSYGRERIFVNCGSHETDMGWQEALRTTAAHNALELDGQSACEIAAHGGFGARRVKMVDPVREETRETCLLDCSHDGYMGVFGVTHRRRLFMTMEGHDLRGEDTLISTMGAPMRPHEIALRFHVHPRVQVSLIQDGAAALLRLPSGVGWRFSFSGGELGLEDSVYLGEGAPVRKTKQLVIHGDMVQDTAQIKWAMQREGL